MFVYSAGEVNIHACNLYNPCRGWSPGCWPADNSEGCKHNTDSLGLRPQQPHSSNVAVMGHEVGLDFDLYLSNQFIPECNLVQNVQKK